MRSSPDMIIKWNLAVSKRRYRIRFGRTGPSAPLLGQRRLGGRAFKPSRSPAVPTDADSKRKLEGR